MAAFSQWVGQGEETATRALSWGERGLLVVIAAAAFATTSWPTPLLRSWVRELAGHPRYAGPWLVVEHALLYTTLCAGICLACWAVLARLGWLPAPTSWLSLGERPLATVAWGVVPALILVPLHLGLVFLLNHLGYLPGRWELSFGFPEGWRVLGNLFSNFYEELIYRGFLLVVARAVLRNTPLAVVATSLIFGLDHEQYLPQLQVLLTGAGVVMGLSCVRAHSIWAAWLCHQLYDMLLSLVLG